MKKKYTARSILSFNIQSGKFTRRISFMPLTNDTSYFVTESKTTQDAIESHAFFKKGLIKVSALEDAVLQAKIVEETKAEAEDVKEKKLKEIVVGGQSDAVDYLTEQFGVSRSKLRSQKAIADVAASYGVVFVYS